MVRTLAIRTRSTGPDVETYRWQDDAACSGIDPKYFEYQDKEDPGYKPQRGLIGQKIRILGVVSSNTVRLRGGQKVCEGCPVAELCLASADGADMHYTIRGGYLPTKLTNPEAIGPMTSWTPISPRQGTKSAKRRKSPTPSETCKRGHDNWRFRPNGRRECVDCTLLRNRARFNPAILQG